MVGDNGWASNGWLTDTAQEEELVLGPDGVYAPADQQAAQAASTYGEGASIEAEQGISQEAQDVKLEAVTNAAEEAEQSAPAPATASYKEEDLVPSNLGPGKSDPTTQPQEAAQKTGHSFPDLTGKSEKEVLDHFEAMSDDELKAYIEHIEKHGNELEAQDKAAGKNVEAYERSDGSGGQEQAGAQQEKSQKAIAKENAKGPGSMMVKTGQALQWASKWVDRFPGLDFVGGDFACAAIYAAGGAIEARGYEKNGHPEYAQDVMKAKMAGAGVLAVPFIEYSDFAGLGARDAVENKIMAESAKAREGRAGNAPQQQEASSDISTPNQGPAANQPPATEAGNRAPQNGTTAASRSSGNAHLVDNPATQGAAAQMRSGAATPEEVQAREQRIAQMRNEANQWVNRGQDHAEIADRLRQSYPDIAGSNDRIIGDVINQAQAARTQTPELEAQKQPDKQMGAKMDGVKLNPEAHAKVQEQLDAQISRDNAAPQFNGDYKRMSNRELADFCKASSGNCDSRLSVKDKERATGAAHQVLPNVSDLENRKEQGVSPMGVGVERKRTVELS